MAKPKKDFVSNLPKYFVVAVFAAGAVGALTNAFRSGDAGTVSESPVPSENTASVVSVTVPNLSAAAQSGEYLFKTNCATCHGVNAAGTETGPPLVNDIYNPGHHSDDSFYAAVENGVPQHHWPFGNMPKQAQVSTEQVAKIIAYVRELQQANGITYREHTM